MKMAKAIRKLGLLEIPQVPDENRPLPHTSVGIEVELEGLLTPPDIKYWLVTQDGSLHQGVEFVSHPVFGTGISAALNELQGVLHDGMYGKAIASYRTSVHIHLNILDMEVEAFTALCALYLKYEPALFRMHPKRSQNIFCVPLWKSRKALDNLIYCIDNLNNLQRAPMQSKYAALNANSLGRFGTLEFRHMGGTTDMIQVSEWINVIMELKAAAIRGDNDVACLKLTDEEEAQGLVLIKSTGVM